MDDKRPLKRKLKQPQSPLACEACRAKKVRCDLTERRSRCSRCESADVRCNIVPGKRRHLAQRIMGANGAVPLLNVSYTSTTNDQTSPNSASSTASEDSHSPCSTMSWASYASSASSANSTDASSEHLPQPSSSASKDLCLPPYVKPLPATLSSATCDNLRQQGCFHLPDAETRTEVVEAYMRWVHTSLPMISPVQLQMIKILKPTCKPMSLLLLKSIEMVAYVFLRKDGILASSLARQVECLLQSRVESDPLVVLQSLILMTFLDIGKPGTRDSYDWIGVASRYAARLNFDDLELQTGRVSVRYTLWSLIVRDSLVSLASRKPRQVDTALSSVLSSLPPADQCFATRLQDNKESVDRIPCARRMTEDDVFQSTTDLCKAVQATIDTKLSPSGSSSIRESTDLLRSWHGRWHERLSRVLLSAQDHSRLLHCSAILSYWSLAVSTLHCWSPQPTASPVLGVPCDTGLVSTALSCATEVYTGLYGQDLVQYIPATAIAALVPAAVAHMKNSTSPYQQMRAVNSQKYYRCWQILRELRSKYQSADQAMRMLDSLGQDLRQQFDAGDAENVMSRLRLWCDNESLPEAECL